MAAIIAVFFCCQILAPPHLRPLSMSLRKSSVASISPIASGSAINTVPTNGAARYETNETAATTITYGSCVFTCTMWLHWAPADAMIVVSDIGEQ